MQEADAGYCIDGDLIVLNDEEFGQIDIRGRGDALFQDELKTLQWYATKKKNKATIRSVLQEAHSIITVQAIWSRSTEETLTIIDPLFYWLLNNRRGIVVVEGGEFFNKDGLVE